MKCWKIKNKLKKQNVVFSEPCGIDTVVLSETIANSFGNQKIVKFKNSQSRMTTEEAKGGASLEQR